MNTDCYFEIGNSHTICQDYALAGRINEHLSYAIVSDGCSSSEMVDVGARLLAHSAKEYLQTAYHEYEELPEIKASTLAVPIIVTATRHARDLMMPLGALDATLLIALSDGKRFISIVYGDGAVIAKKKCDEGDTIIYQDVSFNSGAPYYLSYLLLPARNIGYRKHFEEKAIIQKHSVTEGNFTSLYDPREVTNFNDLYDEAMYCGNEGDFEWVALVSDGIKTYEIHDEEGDVQDVPEPICIEHFTGYKSYKGKFVERRMRRMRKDCENDRITHYDDISIATIHMD